MRLYFLKIHYYLFERQSYTGEGKEDLCVCGQRERESENMNFTSSGLLPKRVQWLWLGQTETRMQELHAGMLFGCRAQTPGAGSEAR